MKKVGQKLSLDRPATYQIKVPGHIGESWSAGHCPDRHHRPGRFAGSAAPALLPGLAVDFGHLC